MVTPTPGMPASEPAATPSVSEPAVSQPDYGMDLRTTEIPAEGGEAARAPDDNSPLSQLAKKVKW